MINEGNSDLEILQEKQIFKPYHTIWQYPKSVQYIMSQKLFILYWIVLILNIERSKYLTHDNISLSLNIIKVHWISILGIYWKQVVVCKQSMLCKWERNNVVAGTRTPVIPMAGIHTYTQANVNWRRGCLCVGAKLGGCQWQSDGWKICQMLLHHQGERCSETAKRKTLHLRLTKTWGWCS